MQNFFECMKNLCTIAQCFPKIGRTHRDDHELLQVEVVVGMRAAVNHIHHRHWHLHGAHAAEIAVQGQTGFFRGGARYGHRYGEHGIGPQAAFVFGAIEIDQSFVQKGLLRGIQAEHRLRNFGVDVLHRLEHAPSEVACRIPVAQLDGFAAAS